ncbi:MAG: right-handed parallel beta-helix repeat-containing protein [Verrucomicrobiales bacterium]
MHNIRDFGAAGDGATDDTPAIEHALSEGGGVLYFPPGQYRITRTVEIDLAQRGPAAIWSPGGAELIMAGGGPALRLTGSHDGTADPWSLTEATFGTERFPALRGIAILGDHPEADGVELVKTFQATLDAVLIRRVRHGIRLAERNRNVLISGCHIFQNTGAGIYFDGVNLHQAIISASHLSYCRLGGIRIERSEIRNLQITGNDIEYNNTKAHKGKGEEPTAEIYVDVSAPGASMEEVTIASNTIQATATKGGCNIRIIEKGGEGRPPGIWAISGNIIGSQENNVHLTGCAGVTLSGNFIYSCGHRNVLAEDCTGINLSGNNFRRHTGQFGTGVRFARCRDSLLTGCAFADESEAGQQSGASLLELDGCERIQVTGCQFVGGAPYAIDAHDCRRLMVANCTAHDPRPSKAAKASARLSGSGEANRFALNAFEDGIDAADGAGLADG